MVAGTACGYGVRLWSAVVVAVGVAAAAGCGYGLRLWCAAMVCGYGVRLWVAVMVSGSAAGCEIENVF